MHETFSLTSSTEKVVEVEILINPTIYHTHKSVERFKKTYLRGTLQIIYKCYDYGENSRWCLEFNFNRSMRKMRHPA
jgi:hypothetical protein